MTPEIRARFIKFLIFHRRSTEQTAVQYIEHVEKFERVAARLGFDDICRIPDYPTAFEILLRVRASGNQCPGPFHGRPLSDSYVKKIGYMVSMYWQFCILYGYKEGRNPFETIPGIRKPQFAAPDYFERDSDAVKKILAYPRTFRDKALFYVLFSSAIRRAEAVNLMIEDVAGNTVMVRKGKGGKTREAPICPQTKKYIEAHVDNLRKIGYAGPWLFPRYDFTGPMRPDSLNKLCRRLAKKIGLRRLTPHMLRHSFAAHAVERGVPISMIQTWMGHDDIRSTIRYTHHSKRQLAERYSAAMVMAS